ncbi:hypothetical protein BC826DRAFT_1062740, partial [Russula brevipes]
ALGGEDENVLKNPTRSSLECLVAISGSPVHVYSSLPTRSAPVNQWVLSSGGI